MFSTARLMKQSLLRSPPAYSQIYKYFTTLPQLSHLPLATGSIRNRSQIREIANARRNRSYGLLMQSRPRNPFSSSSLAFYSTHSTSRPCPDCPHQSSTAHMPSIPSVPTKPTHSNHLPTSPSYLNSLPPSLRRLAATLPSPPGRAPSQDQLLQLTTSFFERLKIRFKWATIRSYRRYRPDDYSAFVSVGMAGTLTWFLISTTSFFAFCFAVINSLSLQEGIARALGRYLTLHTGVTVIFESAIVPKWGFAGGGSRILFKNVYLSRGPAGGTLDVHASLPDLSEEEIEEQKNGVVERESEMESSTSNLTHFHLSIDTVEVSLSFSRWLDGKGLVRDATVTGVRGVVDRSHVRYDPNAPHDRFAYRHIAHPGDFWLENLQVQDFLVTVYQPDHFRPYTFSIFNADIRKLRKQWLFYDLLSADSITGQVDNCLFSLHKPQSIGRTSEEDLKDVRWGRMSRFRVDGVPIDHMQSSHDQGVLSWVTSGRCDLVADIRFPLEESEADLSTIVADLVDILDKEISSHVHVGAYRPERIPGSRGLKGEALEVPKSWRKDERAEEEKTKSWKKRGLSLDRVENDLAAGIEGEERNEEEEERQRKKEADRMVSIDLDIRFKDLKASVPFVTSDFSYVNNALIRPIVAFLNSNRTLIPIRCHFDLSLDEFDGSWTTYDCGLLDRTSEQVYAALAHHVQDANNQRIQTVSLWTLRLTAEAVLSAFRRGLGEAERNGLFA